MVYKPHDYGNPQAPSAPHRPKMSREGTMQCGHQPAASCQNFSSGLLAPCSRSRASKIRGERDDVEEARPKGLGVKGWKLGEPKN